MIRQDVLDQFVDENREGYFNSAGVTLTPLLVKEKMKAYFDGMCQNSFQNFVTHAPCMERLRSTLADLMNADSPDELALIRNTAEGSGIIGNGIDWQEGDALMTLDREYPSTIYPWMNLERRKGVRLILLEEKDGRVDEDEIIRALERERPRMLALSAVEWCSGYRFDLEKIGAVCRDLGVFFFVDSAQALGFSEVDVQAAHISAMSGPACKWLMGPTGVGYLYLRRDLLDTIDPVCVGSDSVVDPYNYLDYNFTMKPDMRRFEFSTANLGAYVWFDASLCFLLGVGLENLREHVFGLQDYTIERLRAIGCDIRGDLPREKRSGIMAFRHPGYDSLALSGRMEKEAGIFARERDGFVRLSFHVYSTRAGVDRVVDFLG